VFVYVPSCFTLWTTILDWQSMPCCGSSREIYNHLKNTDITWTSKLCLYISQNVAHILSTFCSYFSGNCIFLRSAAVVAQFRLCDWGSISGVGRGGGGWHWGHVPPQVFKSALFWWQSALLTTLTISLRSKNFLFLEKNIICPNKIFLFSKKQLWYFRRNFVIFGKNYMSGKSDYDMSEIFFE
jgi:hypothetical protein